MFKINGEDIEMIYALEVAQTDDKRVRAYANHKYIKPYFESTKVHIQEFKQNGSPIDFCVKGGRPKFKKLSEIYVYDWSYEEDWICITKPSVTTLDKRTGGQYLLHPGNDSHECEATVFVVEMIAGGGGGTGGGALLAGVGGGSGAYAMIAVDVNKLPYAYSNGWYRYGRIYIRVKTLNTIISSSDVGGTGAANRGTAQNGRGIEVLYVPPNDSLANATAILTCNGGFGASEGTPGNGGNYQASENLPEAVMVIYSANGISAEGGVGSSTISCQQNTISIGYDSEGDEYKLTRGGFTGVTEGGGASSGAPSQFGNGGAEGKTNNGYDGGNAERSAYGAGGGGGHGKAFSQSNGGNGGRPKVYVYSS